jgi:hypothetical protein
MMASVHPYSRSRSPLARAIVMATAHATAGLRLAIAPQPEGAPAVSAVEIYQPFAVWHLALESPHPTVIDDA